MYNVKHNNRLQGCMMGNRESYFLLPYERYRKYSQITVLLIDCTLNKINWLVRGTV